MDRVKVSVIVPVFNAEKTISACVNALLIQRVQGADIEIITVDDGSTDTTADILRTFDRVLYVFQPNAGPAAARNHGARIASGDILVFTDSDCIAEQDWISRLLTPFCADGADAAAGSYGIANPESLLARCVHQEILYRHEHLMGEWVEVFGSYNAAVRRVVFQEAGGFDETYRFPSGEDNDLSYRLRRAGVRIRFVPEARVAHRHPESVRRYLDEQFRHGFWRVKMYRAFPSMMKGDGYTFWKDPLEIALVILTGGLALAGFFAGPAYAASGGGIAVVWFAGEMVFARAMGLSFGDGAVFFAGVMVLRSWWRAAGFFRGMIPKKI